MSASASGLAARERAIRRPTLEFGRRRSLLFLSLVPAFLLALNTVRVEAQQPLKRPAPWSGSVTPPASIIGLDDARPFMPLELSRAWLGKVESVRVRRDQMATDLRRIPGVAPRGRKRVGPRHRARSAASYPNPTVRARPAPFQEQASHLYDKYFTVFIFEHTLHLDWENRFGFCCGCR
mgnify:CR=1 FL=1